MDSTGGFKGSYAVIGVEIIIDSFFIVYSIFGKIVFGLLITILLLTIDYSISNSFSFSS